MIAKEDNSLTLEKLKISDRLSVIERRFDVLESRFDDKTKYLVEAVNNFKKEVLAVDRSSNLQAINLVEKLGKLPCCVHENELKWVKGGLYTVYVFMAGLIVKAIHSWIKP